jgi:hypothetical protein
METLELIKAAMMRLPRVRLTMRRLMTAMAIVALMLGEYHWLDRMGRRRDAFLRRAEYHRRLLCNYVEFPGHGPELGRQLQARYERIRAWHATMERTYFRVAARPWESVPPDPPCPEPSWNYLPRELFPPFPPVPHP